MVARHVAARAAAAAALVGAAAAQGAVPIQGVWDHIQPNTNAAGVNPYPGCPVNAGQGCFGPLTLWPHTTFDEGAMYAAGTDATGAARLYSFDVVSWQWQPFTATVPGFMSADLGTWGGFVVAVGGSSDDFSTQVALMPTTVGPANGSWTLVPAVNVPSAHDGHRMVVFGGVVYMIGGLTNDPVKGWLWSNAMWAMDLATFLASPSAGPGDPGAAVPWYRVQPINAPGVFSPRGAFSLATYSATVLLFGGLTRNPAASGSPICAQPGSACTTFNDLWAWQPGASRAPLSDATCGGGNCGWSLVPVSGPAVPPPRYGHAAGVMGGHMYVFGGLNAQGQFLTDLWAFSVDGGYWTQVQGATRGFSAFPTQLWEPGLAVVGRNLYVEMTGDAGGNAIYRFVPNLPTLAPPAPGAPGAPDAGHTAGIALAVLLGVANLVLVWGVARSQGSIPAVLGALPGFHKDRQHRASPDGFYTSSAAAAAADALGGYVAPPAGADGVPL